MTTSVDKILQNLPLYRCSTQITPSSPVITRHIRVGSDDIMFDMVKRFTATPDLNKLSFFEVHKTMPGSNETVVVVEDNRPWPKGVPTNTYGATFRVKETDNEDKLRMELNQFFEDHAPQVGVTASKLPALPPPKVEDKKPLTLPLHRYILKVA